MTVKVTQEDRFAAAPYANCLRDMQDIFDGKADGLPVVQAFALHREAAYAAAKAQAAGVARKYLRNTIATAIEAMEPGK